MAVSQSSRDKSEVRSGEYGVNGNVASFHAQPQAGCLATPRALSHEKNSIYPTSGQPLLSTAHALCPALLTG